MIMKKTTLSLMIAACFASSGALAEEAKLLAPVVVTATRVEQDSFDLPMSIDKIDKSIIQDGQLRMTLSESLARIPGITAQNRNQMAQDPQISSRGFGARSSFGVRGIRIYLDGIPLSMPDGIGNPGSVDLGTIGAIEVMRGPFSAMYGNSSGGVIQMFSQAAPATPEISGDVLFGSFNTRRQSVQATGTRQGVEYLLNLSDYSSDGFRLNSANEKRQSTARLGIKIDEDTKLTALINAFDQSAQDPGGLRRVATLPNEPSAFTDPTGVSIGALNAKTRVIRSNTQVGFNLEKRINASNTFNLITYAGQRDNTQYLSTGGVNGRASTIGRDFFGAELRMTTKGSLLDKPYTVTYGLTGASMEDARKDEPTTSGVISGAMTRSEKQTATNVDQYAQGVWSFADRWDVHAGVRHTKATLKNYNNLTTNNIGNGSLAFDKTIPVVGLVFKATPLVNLYANIGKGFETPTLLELTYSNAATGTGPNLTIRPSTSTNIEVGSKMILSDTARMNVALFDISTENEIVVNQLSGATASYQNAGKTKRRGIELSAEALLPNNFSVYGAYTMLDASFSTGFNSTSGTNTVTVASGNVIPGTYRTQIYAEAAWKYQPVNFQTALEVRHNSKVYVNDINTDMAPSSTIISARASLQQIVNSWRITEYARIDNLFDKDYIGSIRVNDTNTRFFEPAPGRNWIAGVKATYTF